MSGGGHRGGWVDARAVARETGRPELDTRRRTFAPVFPARNPPGTGR